MVVQEMFYFLPTIKHLTLQWKVEILRVVNLLFGFVGIFLFGLLFFGTVLFCLLVGFFCLVWFGLIFWVFLLLLPVYL